MRVLLWSTLVILPGCVAVQPWGSLRVDDARGFEPDRTTKEEIRERFGDPPDLTTAANGKELWQYGGHWWHSGEDQGEGRYVSFIFDASGKLSGVFFFHSFSGGEVPWMWRDYPLPIALTMGASERWSEVE